MSWISQTEISPARWREQPSIDANVTLYVQRRLHDRAATLPWEDEQRVAVTSSTSRESLGKSRRT